MGIVNTKSTLITNLDARPAVMNDPRAYHGRVYEQAATLAIAAGDDDTSVYRFARLHSSWRVSAIDIWNDAITGGTDFDLGLHRTAEDGGAEADHDLFGVAISLASARAAAGPLNATCEALDINKIAKPIWELLGLSADPGLFYDLTLTANTVGTTAGDVSVQCRYVAGG